MTQALLLSKAMVNATYRQKAALMARAEPGLDLTLFVPDRWPEGGTVVEVEETATLGSNSSLGTETPAPDTADGYHMARVPIRLSGHFHLHWYPGLRNRVAAVSPDLVHIDEEPYNVATVQAIAAARAAGARTLFFTWQNLDRPLPPPFGRLEKWTFRRADGAIAGTESAANVLRDRGFAGPVWVLPQFGVDEHLYAPRAELAARRSGPVDAESCGQPFRAGYVGRLVPEKGVDLLIEAAASEARWGLVIAGEGPRRASLEAQAQAAGMRDRVRFLGRVAPEALPDLYRSLDVLVLPSRRTPRWIEQFGRVLVEAMACGVPCVGAATGEIGAVMGDGGLTFAEGDRDDLARVLRLLAEDPELRGRLARAGRERAVTRYTMDRIAGETVRIYGEVMAGGRPNAR